MSSLLKLLLWGSLLPVALSCRTAVPLNSIPDRQGQGLSSPHRLNGDAPLVSLPVLLRDPSRFESRQIEVEGFVERCEAGFVLSPDLRSLEHSVLENLAYVDTLQRKVKGSLSKAVGRAYYRLRGKILDDKGQGSGKPCYRFTILVEQCAEVHVRE